MESLTTEEEVKKIILEAIYKLTQKGCTVEDIKLYNQRQRTGALQTNGDRFHCPDTESLGAPSDCPACQRTKRKRCQRRRSCPPKCRKPSPCPKPCPRCASDSEVSGSDKEDDSGTDYTSDDVEDAIVELVQRSGVLGCTTTEIRKHLQKEGANMCGEEMRATLDYLVERKKLQFRNGRYTINPDDEAEEESSGEEEECPSCQKERACRKKKSCKRKPRCKRKKICSGSWCEKPKRDCKTGCPKCNEGQSEFESDSGSDTD